MKSISIPFFMYFLCIKHGQGYYYSSLFCMDFNMTNCGPPPFYLLSLKTTPGVSGHDLFVRAVGNVL